MLRGILVAVANLVLVPTCALWALTLNAFAPGREKVLHVAHWWAGAILRAGGVRIRREGFEHLPAGRKAVLVANHSSAFDIYAVVRHLPLPYRMVAKESLFRVPLFGHAIRAAGLIPLERSGTRRDLSKIEAMITGLPPGTLVVFFAEGTRSTDGRLRRFKRGAFATAIRHGMPIVPLAISGAHRVQRPGSAAVRAGEIVLTVLPPIETAGLAAADRDELAERAFAALAAALPAEQQPVR